MVKVKYRQISDELLKMASPIVDSQNTSIRSSINTSIDAVEHYRIDINKLSPYTKQARRNFDEKEIEGLALSIKQHGIRQPLTVIQSNRDFSKYEVVSGERRLRAAKIAGVQKIPCIIISDHSLAEEIALVENIQRQDLHPVELGEAFLNILDSRKGLSQISLAEKLGISNKVISESIQYAKLPNVVKDVLISKNIKGRDILRKILKLENPKEFVQKLGFDERKKNIQVGSVVRIHLKDGKFHVQSKSMHMLDQNKKSELRILLHELISIL